MTSVFKIALIFNDKEARWHGKAQVDNDGAMMRAGGLRQAGAVGGVSANKCLIETNDGAPAAPAPHQSSQINNIVSNNLTMDV